MQTLNIYEIKYNVINLKNNETTIKLNLPEINDNDFPTVSIVVPTYNRPHFFELIMRNWERIDYPREKLELIICDDTPNAKKPYITDKNIRYYILPKKLSIGEKRNLLCCAAKNEYIVHMDDDDWYPPESVACRIRVLLYYQSIINKDACFGCNKVLCLDLVGGQMFEAFDNSVDGLPSTISESTMAYSKRYWENQKFDKQSKFTECLPFIKNRTDTLCTCPSIFIVTQFTHGSNTIHRYVEKNYLSEYNCNQFEKTLSVYDTRIFNNIRAKIIQNIPTYKEAIDFFNKYKDVDNNNLNKFLKDYKYLDPDIKSNPLVINLYQNKLISDKKSSGKDIIYYCGPGNYLKFSNKWNPLSKQIGGSEEAVINLSKEFVSKGYNVTVYCVLEGKSKIYDGVMYKPYYEWIPKNFNDITIIWRDPSITKQIINSNKIFLDLHDAINPEWLLDIDTNIKIMTKSKFHTNIINPNNMLYNHIHNIPNGIYINNQTIDNKIDNLMICTSSPDRCLRALLKALPLIRLHIPNAHIYWAYGFKSGITEGGMEKDIRTKKWVEESKNIIDNTEGFTDLGRLDQTEVNELYKKAEFFIYPTCFPEIDCISLTKAISYSCIPICSPSGALAEKLNMKEQCAKLNNDKIDYSLEDGPEFDKFIKNVIYTIKNKQIIKIDNDVLTSNINSTYSWNNIANRWIEYF